jgi:hypothetical protein
VQSDKIIEFHICLQAIIQGVVMKQLPVLLSMLAAFSVSLTHAAETSSYKPPRTVDGKPDLQGVWTNVSLTTLLRSPQFKTDVIPPEVAARIEQQRAQSMAKSLEPTDPNAPAPPKGGNVGGYNSFFGDSGETLAKVKGQYRTTWLLNSENGQLPYSPQGRKLFDSQLAFTRNNFDGPEARPMAERCVVGFGSTGGPPMINVLYNNNYQIVQSKDTVVILVEMNHDARIVRVNGKHRPSSVKTWMGDSVGRWEGDTLVVETINFHPGESLRTNFNQSFYISPKGKVIERFTRTAPTEILYEFSVEDPDIYSRTWRAEMVMNKADGLIYEYACHEGNYALPGILAGAREAEKNGEAITPQTGEQ